MSATHEVFSGDERGGGCEGVPRVVVEEYDYDCTDGGEVVRGRRKKKAADKDTPSSPLMWIVTEEQK